jgi:hypothetical protein
VPKSAGGQSNSTKRWAAVEESLTAEARRRAECEIDAQVAQLKEQLG